MNHVMIDLETLGTSADAVVLSIGAVKFDPMKPFYEKTDDAFYAVLDIGAQITAGRTIGGDTFGWWMRQGKQARLAIAGEDVAKVDPSRALSELRSWIPKKPDGVWGNGSDFDNAILQHMASQLGLPSLWPFWANRCFRTFTKLFDPKKQLRPVANDHHAVHDCINQIYWMQNIIAEEGLSV